jgi:selenophosphate synthetase-related protein
VSKNCQKVVTKCFFKKGCPKIVQKFISSEKLLKFKKGKKKEEEEDEEEEKYEGFPRPGGNFVAPGKK